MKEKTVNSLRAVHPSIYQLLINMLKEYHIHPYDIRATAIENSNGIEIILQYGNGFIHEMKRFFPLEQQEILTKQIREFSNHVAEACKKVMVAEYFKMMKP